MYVQYCSSLSNTITSGAGTILYVEGPTNQNKCCGKSGGGTKIKLISKNVSTYQLLDYFC